MLGQYGKPFHVYGNPRPVKVDIKRVVPYRNEINSHFCDSCVREFDEGEEAVFITTHVEDWEEDPHGDSFLVCDTCYAGGLKED